MEILRNTSLQAYNSFGFDVTAEYYCEVQNLDELRQALACAAAEPLEILVIGGGSNLILRDNIPGLVILNRLKGIRIDADPADDKKLLVSASGGENWHDFVRYTLEQQAFGLENLSLIPGTVGAAPMQNIGAYGVEIKDRMHSLTALDRFSGELRTFTTPECDFGYRDSVFKQDADARYIITEVCFELSREPCNVLNYAGLAEQFAARGNLQPSPVQISDLICEIRQSKLPDPAVTGNAGSFFKNPVVDPQLREAILKDYPDLVSFPEGEGFKLAAGWLIDRCGWKGYRKGDAGVYERQALVLVNHGAARGGDILALAAEIQESVKRTFAVQLEIEPRTFPV